MIAYMQTNTTQKALAAGLKKAQQTTEKERRRQKDEARQEAARRIFDPCFWRRSELYQKAAQQRGKQCAEIKTARGRQIRRPQRGGGESRKQDYSEKPVIAELFRKGNPRDKHFLKYLPDEKLTEEPRIPSETQKEPRKYRGERKLQQHPA